MSRKNKEALQGIIYILPSFVLILVFCIVPIFMSAYFSFTDYNIMNPPEFAGLDNYVQMFKDDYVTAAVRAVSDDHFPGFCRFYCAEA